MLALLCGTILALVPAGEPGLKTSSVLLDGWEVGTSNSDVDLPTRWLPADASAVISNGAPRVWFRTVLPQIHSDSPAILLEPFLSGRFDFQVDSQQVLAFPVKGVTLPLFTLPRGSAGKRLYVRSIRALNKRIPLTSFIRYGSKADLLEFIVADELPKTVKGLLVFAVGVLAAILYLSSLVQKQPTLNGPFAIWWIAWGLYYIPQESGHLALWVFPHPTILRSCAAIGGSIELIGQAYFLQLLYNRPTRFWLIPVAWLSLVFTLVATFGYESGLFHLPHEFYWFCAWDATINALFLANAVVAWKTLGPSVRWATAGLILGEALMVGSLVFRHILGLPIAPSLFVDDFSALIVLAALLICYFLVSIANREAREQEHQKHLTISANVEMGYRLAHDVRKPFALLRLVIRGLQASARAGPMAEPLRRADEEVVGLQAEANHLIEGLLKGGRDQALDLASQELESLLLESYSRSMKLNPESSVTLSHHFDHTRQVVVDRFRVLGALSNIFCNALEAMGARGGTLALRTSDVVADGKSMVELSVLNTNSLISPAQLSRIFGQFATEGKKGGSGIGLWSTKLAVEAHGGSIRCVSSNDRGVEFILTLPASDQPRGAALEWPNTTAPVLPSSHRPVEGGHVVLVEDSPSTRWAWRQALPPGKLVEFESPQHALQALENTPDCFRDAAFVVLDHRFQPGQIDGVELGERLRGATEARIFLCSNVPVIGLPSCFDGQLAKTIYTMEALAAATAA